jgi:hypothetical protein
VTSCGRGCCFTGLQVCARAYTCACHWDDRRPAAVKGGADATYADPTAQKAIHNVMKEGKRK